MKSLLKHLSNKMLVGLDNRQKDVLESRFGLLKPEALTLAAIGQKYGITREGIRRIEAQALEKAAKNTSDADFQDFINRVIAHLNKFGGVRRESDLINDIRLIFNDDTSADMLSNYLRFILKLSGAVKYHRDTKEFYSHWYLSDKHRDQAVKFIGNLVKVLQGGTKSAELIKSPRETAFVSISKKFARNHYGDFGLVDSPEIVPKNARDWAYLILKKEGRPLHFMELAKIINSLQSKQLHPQTVHNELIKNDDFVLVGKGMYGLREHGYEPGIAREVIARLIQKHGPMTADKIVDLVAKERFFKRNTVIINLQSRRHFKRLADGRYTTLA